MMYTEKQLKILEMLVERKSYRDLNQTLHVSNTTIKETIMLAIANALLCGQSEKQNIVACILPTIESHTTESTESQTTESHTTESQTTESQPTKKKVRKRKRGWNFKKFKT